MAILSPTPRTMSIWQNGQVLNGTTSTDERAVRSQARGMSTLTKGIYYVVDSDLSEIHHFYWMGVEYSPNISETLRAIENMDNIQ